MIDSSIRLAYRYIKNVWEKSHTIARECFKPRGLRPTMSLAAALIMRSDMLLERTDISVKAGTEEEFYQTMNDRGLPILSNFPGVVEARLGRGVENPGKFIFLVQWESMEDHAAFNKAEIHHEFLQLFGPYVEGAAMEHFRMY